MRKKKKVESEQAREAQVMAEPERPFDYGAHRLAGKIVHEYDPGTVYERWEFQAYRVTIEARSEQEAKDRVRAMFGGEQHG